MIEVDISFLNMGREVKEVMAETNCCKVNSYYF